MIIKVIFLILTYLINNSDILIAGRCNSVPVVANANIFTKGNNSNLMYGTVVKYICHPGYDLVGSQQIVCLNYTWSHQSPTCKSKLHHCCYLKNKFVKIFFPFQIFSIHLFWKFSFVDFCVCRVAGIRCNEYCIERSFNRLFHF